jgi:uncharacterized SAM-binding protein YcdF (DUF218 family)
LIRSARRWLGLGVLLAAAVLLHAQWLPLVASFLVKTDPVEAADAIFVLGGDHFGDRITHAALLARQGFAPKVYVSGPAGVFDRFESELAIEFAEKHGFKNVSFVPLPNHCTSTRDEAEQYMPEFRRLGFKKVLVVTSNFHTRRAGKILRAVASEPTIVMVAAPTREFHPEDWWRRRQDQKNLFLEWTKTLAAWIGL